MTFRIAGSEREAVISDVNGTLYGSWIEKEIFSEARLELARALLEETLRGQEQIVIAKKDEYENLRQKLGGWGQAYLKLGGDMGMFNQIVHSAYDHAKFTFNEPLYEMLSGLREHARLGLLTNTSDRVTEQVCTGVLGSLWRGLFSAVVYNGTPGCPARKPDERAFQFILQKLNVPPERAVMVGDDLEDDILPAIRLGLLTVHVGVESSGPWDKQISKLEDFPNLLDK